MWVQKRIGAKGKVYFSVLTKDKTGKIVRTKNKDLPKFQTEDEVRA